MVAIEIPGVRLVFLRQYSAVEDKRYSRVMSRAKYLFSRLPRIREVRFDPARLPA
jgi:hypothetical protein